MLSSVVRAAVRALRVPGTALVVLLVLVSPMPATAAAQAVDVFGQPIQPASGASDAFAASGAAPDSGAPDSTSASLPPSPPARAVALPAFVRVPLMTAIVWQGRLDARIADAARELYGASSPWAWFTLLGFAFAYGVLHALGPGHGKLVGGAWLGSRRARVAHAAGLAGWSATVQALSAIVLVFGSAWIARAGMENVLSDAAALDVVSCLLLCVAGAWTLCNVLARRDCCVEPGAVKLVPRGKHTDTDAGDDDGGDTYLGASLRLGARRSTRRSRFAPASGASGASATGTTNASVVSQILVTGFASGIRPCVGSIFVLIASMAAHAPWIGVAACFAIAAGVAVTVTLFGLGAIGVNRLIAGRGVRLRARLQATRRIVAIVGALAIVLFGAVQAALILTGYLQPALT